MENALLEIRKAKNARKPEFRHQDSWKQKRLKTNSWRKPRGMHSKIRMCFRGNPKMPSPGYRAPAAVRGLHPSGLTATLVTTPKQLDLAPEAIIIAAAVGTKKKLEIIKKAAEKKIPVLNINAEEFSRKAGEEMAKRKKAKPKAAEPQKKEEKKPLKDAEAKEAKSEEDKRKEAQKEMEKVITKRE